MFKDSYLYTDSNTVSSRYSEQPWFVLGTSGHYHRQGDNNPVISQYYSFEANEQGEQVFAVPDGCIDIVFGGGIDNPCALVCGSKLEACIAGLKYKERYFGVRFAPGMIPSFLNIDAQDILAKNIPLNELVPGAKMLIEHIVNAESITDQVSSFSHFFHTIVGRKFTALTLHTLHVIERTAGCIQINDLASETGYTARTLQRQFRKETGMTPKMLCRIMRCQAALHAINHRETVLFSALSQDLGFSDQAHFTREFSQLIHSTPANYRQQVAIKPYSSYIFQH